MLIQFEIPRGYAVDATSGDIGAGEVRVHQYGRIEVRPAKVRSAEVRPAKVRRCEVREDRPGKVRLDQFRVADSCRGEVCLAKVRLVEVRVDELRLVEVRAEQACPGEVRVAKVRPAEVRPTEVGPAEPRVAEVCAAEIGLTEVCLAKVCSLEIRTCGIPVAPRVPSVHPFPKLGGVVAIGHDSPSSNSRRQQAPASTSRLVGALLPMPSYTWRNSNGDTAMTPDDLKKLANDILRADSEAELHQLLVPLTTDDTEAIAQLVRTAAMKAWAERELARGRPESELTWANCAREIGLLGRL
jgi:hypothetical protein